MLDSIRVFIIAVLFVYVASVPFIVWRARRVPGQGFRNVGASFIALGTMQSEIAHIGDYASVRLGVYMAGSVFIAWGLFSMFRYEEPPRLHMPRPRRRQPPP